MTYQTDHPDFTWNASCNKSILDLTEATNRTFECYLLPIRHTPEGFARFCRVCHVDLAQAVWLQNREERMVGLTLLAIRQDRGWCAGFGLTPEFRGQGLAAILLQGLIAQARSLDLRVLQLEVLIENEPAIRTYRRAGFQITGDLLLMAAPLSVVLPHLSPRADTALEILSVEPEEALRFSAQQTPPPSPACWQRETATLYGQSDGHGLVARDPSGLRAVLLYHFNRQSGQITVDSLVFQDHDSAKALLEKAAQEALASAAEIPPSQAPGFFILNEPEDSDLCLFLRSLGWKATRRQHEMRLYLR